MIETMLLNTPWGNCPACGKPVIAQTQVSIKDGLAIAKENLAHEVELKGRVTGLRICHNCIPPVKRATEMPA